MTAAEPAIRIERLSKRYGRVAALEDVSFDVHTGEIFGFLGLNGAGKTTTIRILLDFVRATAGHARVFGADCRSHGLQARARIGYLPGEVGFYGDMTGEATLDVLGRLSPRAIDLRRRGELLERLALPASDLKRPIREYSTGMKRKLGIVHAMQTDAELLILDEPTEGLDPLMQDALYGLLADARRRGRTVFMSSHVLPEVERVCDRIGLLRRGALVLEAPTGDVKRMAARTIHVAFSAAVAPPSAWPVDCDPVAIAPDRWELRMKGPLGPLTALLGPLPVRDLDVREPHLEDVLRRYYSEGAGE